MFPIRKFTLGWWIHPEKDRAWYENEKSRMSEDEVARELDINYSLSMSGKVFPEYQDNRHFTNKPFEPSKHRTIYRIWDFGGVNAALWIYVDEFGRKRLLHERVLGDKSAGIASNTSEQVAVVLQDSFDLFPDHDDFYDICDPSGSDPNGSGESTHVEILQAEGVYPYYSRIREWSTRERKKRGMEAIKRDMQQTPGGKEAFQLFVSEDGRTGCPIIRKALMGGYCYKKDANGNTTDRIEEKHPYEDVIDCLIYFYLETDNGRLTGRKEASYKATYTNHYESPYLGF